MAQKAKPWQELTPQRIRALREALGISQAEFGAMVGEEARRRNTADGIVLNDPRQDAVCRWEIGPGELYGRAILAIEERHGAVATFEREVRNAK